MTITNTFTTEQEVEKFVLSYLETHQEFFRVYQKFFKKVVLPKFSLPKKIRKKKLEMVSEETEERIGQALAEKGQGIIISSREELHSFLESISK